MNAIGALQGVIARSPSGAESAQPDCRSDNLNQPRAVQSRFPKACGSSRCNRTISPTDAGFDEPFAAAEFRARTARRSRRGVSETCPSAPGSWHASADQSAAGRSFFTSASDGSTLAPSTYLKSTMVPLPSFERDLADVGAERCLMIAGAILERAERAVDLQAA